jgi:hypothetical protein
MYQPMYLTVSLRYLTNCIVWMTLCVSGFGWELGPFEQWDIIGVEKIIADVKAMGFKLGAWVEEMLAGGFNLSTL